MHVPTTALVTGATSGIGKALSYLLAEQGINLIVTGRNEVQLSELKSQLISKVEVTTIQADLLIKEERRNIVKKIKEAAPELVINNAGAGLYGDCLTYYTEEQLELLELNVTAVLELTLEAARTLVSKQKKGTIVNISSAAGFQIYPSFAVYSASKCFVTQFSRAFDFEMIPYGIRVLVSCPGMVDTQFRDRAAGGEDVSKEKDEIGQMTSEYVANEIWKQIVSQKQMKIIDWRYRLMTYISSFVPARWMAPLLRNRIIKRILPRTLIKMDR